MKNLPNSSRSMDKINEFAGSLGIKKDEQTVLEIVSSTDNQKVLSLKSGHFGAPEPWFVVDENDKIHTLISIASLKNMLEGLKELQKENFELKLEKAIYQQIPIDFNDAWIVAMDKLMSEVKRQHPNLFVDMEAMMKGGLEN